MALDTKELVLSAEDFNSASRRLDACREALNDAEQDYADAHERLMVVAQGLDPTVSYAKEFTPKLSPRKQPQTPDPQSSEGESTETMISPLDGDQVTYMDQVTGKPATMGPEFHQAFKPNGTTHPEQQD